MKMKNNLLENILITLALLPLIFLLDFISPKIMTFLNIEPLTVQQGVLILLLIWLVKTRTNWLSKE